MRFLKLLLVAAVCLSVTVSVFAHSGGTDSSGGHTNHSTGEYHYHHGYPAHQHSDMDGDGELDCPYDFDDETGSSNGNSNSSSQTSTKPTVQTEPSTVPLNAVLSSPEPSKTVKDTKTLREMASDCWPIIGFFALLVYVAWYEIKWKRKK